jgi:hypothetical protein
MQINKEQHSIEWFWCSSRNVALGSFQLTGVAEPTLAQDAATKNYVDTSASKRLLLLLQNSGLYGCYRFYYRFQY